MKFGIALLVLGLSVGAIGLVATAGITGEVEDRVQTDHASFAQQEAQGLEMWNEQNEQTITMIARSDSIQSGEVSAVEYRLNNWEEHLEADIFRIDYVDTQDGTVLTSTREDYRSVPATDLEIDQSAFDEAEADVPWVSKPHLTEDALGQQAAVVTYVLNVPDDDDRAIVYTADLEAYASELADDGTTTTVLDEDGDVMLDNVDDDREDPYATFGLAYDEDSNVPEEARNTSAGVERIESSPPEALTHDAYDFGSDDYLASYARVMGTDWTVVSHEPTDDAYGFVNAVDTYGSAATVLMVLLIGLVGAILGRNTAVSIDRLTEKAGRMEDGNLDVEFETKREDNIGRLYAGFASMRDALREQIEEAQAARADAEAERERVQRINDELETTATQYSEVMESAAAGDLTARMDDDARNESMAEIARDFNEMLAEIEETVAELNQFATDVATASEEVTASSEEVRSASEQVTASVQEISDGAERQNQSLHQVNNEMSALSTTTEEIAASSNEVADIAERTAVTGRQGQEAAQEAIEAMDQIEGESEQAVEEIRRLEAEVQQIDELINAISEIANQTNMLALNANIEASRSASGDEGEGFAVVAREVKELSEDVKRAATEAEDRLESIREQTEQSAAEVEGTSEQIEGAGEQVRETVEALQEIADYARETNDGVQEISAATEEQAASTEEVVSMVDEAATISEETTAESENVAAAAEQQTSALTEVSRSASELSEQSGQLSAGLDRFDTDADVDYDGFGESVSFDESIDLDGLGGSDGATDSVGGDGATGATPADDAPATDHGADDAPATEPATGAGESAGESDAFEGPDAEGGDVSWEPGATPVGADLEDPSDGTDTESDTETDVAVDEEPDGETDVEADAETDAEADDGDDSADDDTGAADDEVFHFGDVDDEN